jgi:predicted AAA+ superfamily ATPase
LASQGDLNYYERATGTEIDFIFNKKIAVEVKETPIPQDLSQLKVRAEKIGLSETILVGRHDAPKGFNRYLWGGCIFVKE